MSAGASRCRRVKAMSETEEESSEFEMELAEGEGAEVLEVEVEVGEVEAGVNAEGEGEEEKEAPPPDLPPPPTGALPLKRKHSGATGVLDTPWGDAQSASWTVRISFGGGALAPDMTLDLHSIAGHRSDFIAGARTLSLRACPSPSPSP